MAGQDYIENLLEQALSQTRLAPADRGLCHELVLGVTRWQATLDWLIERKTPDRQQKPLLQTLLRMGLYQIFWLDRIPHHAAVHETVEHAKRSGFGPQAGFVNAILRGYLRELDETRTMLADLKRTQPHIGFSHPEWLVKRWQARWGVEAAARLMEWNNTPPKTFARINALQLSQKNDAARPSAPAAGPRPFVDRKFRDAGDVLLQWRDEGVEYDFVRRDWIEDNLVFEFKNHPPITRMPSFQLGLFYVQDPSTLAAVTELDPQPGENVLDLCAAPGGKTTFMAQLMENRGNLVAHDLAPDRLKRVQENCARLGVTCVQTTPTVPPPSGGTGFDRILVDAPCSNTGVMRRRVDLRWRLRPEELDRLKVTQLELLQRAAALLKPGGTLVYSTCSLEPEENQEVVAQLNRPGYQLEYERELQPFRDQVDGAYIASISRS
jgi:16S rRNA (cytosine967-C5)-methyltransferase